MMVVQGRINLTISPEEWLDYAVNNTGIKVFELSPKIALESCNLPGDFPKDPADRIIAATARFSRSQLITKDKKIIDYPFVSTVW